MTESDNQEQVHTARPPSDIELRYYYFGFYRALRRYRTTVLVGWAIVLVGCVSFPVGWGMGRPGGAINIALSCATVAAGLAVVALTVSFLESYVRIAIPAVHNGEQHALVHEILDIMTDVDRGGWHEARAAIQKLLEMEKKYDLPPLT